MLHLDSFIMYQEDECRECPFCGQGLIPFKLGVCICGRQVGNIQYVKNTERFAKNYYSYIEATEYDTAIDETFAGIEAFDFIA